MGWLCSAEVLRGHELSSLLWSTERCCLQVSLQRWQHSLGRACEERPARRPVHQQVSKHWSDRHVCPQHPNLAGLAKPRNLHQPTCHCIADNLGPLFACLPPSVWTASVLMLTFMLAAHCRTGCCSSLCSHAVLLPACLQPLSAGRSSIASMIAADSCQPCTCCSWVARPVVGLRPCHATAGQCQVTLLLPPGSSEGCQATLTLPLPPSCLAHGKLSVLGACCSMGCPAS